MIKTITPGEFAAQSIAKQINGQIAEQLSSFQNQEPQVVYVPTTQDNRLLYVILGLTALVVVGGIIAIALSKK